MKKATCGHIAPEHRRVTRAVSRRGARRAAATEARRAATTPSAAATAASAAVATRRARTRCTARRASQWRSCSATKAAAAAARRSTARATPAPAAASITSTRSPAARLWRTARPTTRRASFEESIDGLGARESSCSRRERHGRMPFAKPRERCAPKRSSAPPARWRRAPCPCRRSAESPSTLSRQHSSTQITPVGLATARPMASLLLASNLRGTLFRPPPTPSPVQLHNRVPNHYR